MIHIETRVRLPFLWGKAAFKKSNWTQVNLIVGPNGSGKTLLANEIATQFRNYDLDVAFLRSDRIPEDQVLAVLRNNQQVKERIESVLSGMFGKSITFREREDGSFVPMVVNKARGVEYNLKEGECHGLKEILQLLIALYNSQGDCLIFDEPVGFLAVSTTTRTSASTSLVFVWCVGSSGSYCLGGSRHL